MRIHYEGFDYYVEGVYTKAKPERLYNERGEPGEQGEPASFEATMIVQHDNDEDGEPMHHNVTLELADDPEFINLCVCEWEGGCDD
jgi:hypothetical protein